MNRKILVISSSPRKGGNSDILCDQFVKGAADAGHQVEKISLADKKIGFCTACYACEKGKCPLQDDAVGIIQKMTEADVIVLGTPVYFYTMCAQLKALIDRSVMVYPNLVKKQFYFIMAMADTDKENFKGTIEALNGCVACYDGSTLEGMVCAAGFYEKGTIADSPYCKEAYELGRSVR